MTIQTSSGFQAAARSQTYGQLALVELKLRSGTARFTNWPLSLQVMGETWQGVDGAAEKLTLTLSPVDIGTRALALGDPSDYQDRGVRVWIALLDAATLQISGEPVLRFAGVMDQMKIERDGSTAKIAMDCRTASYDVRSNPASLRTNDAQHQVKHPGERGFEYLNSMIGSPTVWVNKYLQMALNYWARARGK